MTALPDKPPAMPLPGPGRDVPARRGVSVGGRPANPRPPKDLDTGASIGPPWHRPPVEPEPLAETGGYRSNPRPALVIERASWWTRACAAVGRWVA